MQQPQESRIKPRSKGLRLLTDKNHRRVINAQPLNSRLQGLVII